jgi:insulysin
MKYPQMINRNIEGKVWWRVDRSFGLPTVFVGIRFDFPTIYDNLESNLLFRLLDLYLHESLDDKLQ